MFLRVLVAHVNEGSIILGKECIHHAVVRVIHSIK